MSRAATSSFQAVIKTERQRQCLMRNSQVKMQSNPQRKERRSQKIQAKECAVLISNKKERDKWVWQTNPSLRHSEINHHHCPPMIVPQMQSQIAPSNFMNMQTTKLKTSTNVAILKGKSNTAPTTDHNDFKEGASVASLWDKECFVRQTREICSRVNSRRHHSYRFIHRLHRFQNASELKEDWKSSTNIYKKRKTKK